MKHPKQGVPLHYSLESNSIVDWTKVFYTIWIWFIARHSAVQAVCSLKNGQNAIYWWIPEDRAAGSVIDSLPIEGNSSGNWSEIELRLVEGTQWFLLDSASKNLILKHQVDRDFGDTKLDGVIECKSLIVGDYNFKVNISVSVKVQDVNDLAPFLETAEYHFNVTEELPPGTVVFTGIRAVDADQPGQNSEVLYGILDDGLPTSSLLTVPNPWEGNLAVKNRIDYEQITNFSFTLIAKDNGFPTMSSTAIVYVYVQDVADQNPIFEYERYTANIASDSSPGTALDIFPAHIKAFDGDTLNASLTYTLSGADSDWFEIDAQSGEVRVKKPFADDKSYLLTVHALQSDRPERQASVVLVVRVTNQSSTHPRLMFSSPTFTARISESAPVNSQIMRLSLSEEKENSAVLVYNIVNSHNESHFRVDQEKGTLWLVEPLDYEKKKEHHLRVRVTDGDQSAEADVTVIVENANDNSPIFPHATYTFFANGTASEMAGSIGAVTARDDDEHDRIFYSLLNLNDIFAINDLGQLRIRDPAKLANRSYEIVIAATDSGNPPRVAHTIAKIDIDKSRLSNGEYAFVSRPTAVTSTTTFLVVTVLAGVLLALIVAVMLLAFYICRLRKRKRRTVPTGNRRRQTEHIIVANPMEPAANKRSSWAQSLAGNGADRSIRANTNSPDSSIFPIIAPSPSLVPGGQMHDVALAVDTAHAIEYSLPIIQPRHPGVVLRRPLVENRDSMMSLNRVDQLCTTKQNPWSTTNGTPSLTVYF